MWGAMAAAQAAAAAAAPRPRNGGGPHLLPEIQAPSPRSHAAAAGWLASARLRIHARRSVELVGPVAFATSVFAVAPPVTPLRPSGPPPRANSTVTGTAPYWTSPTPAQMGVEVMSCTKKFFCCWFPSPSRTRRAGRGGARPLDEQHTGLHLFTDLLLQMLLISIC